MLANSIDTKYWTNHNVTNHRTFSSVEESLNYLSWRNAQYFQYDQFMSTQGYDGKTVLDYGCGPGHDLIGLGHFSKPKKLYGMDVSSKSLAQAKQRLDLHKIDAELIQINTNDNQLPLASNSVDYIHCSGVLHHIPNYLAVLNEFKRILKDDGVIKIMVYNYNSIWLHLYVAYLKKIVKREYRNDEIRAAFSKTTDGSKCPTSYVFTPSEFIDVVAGVGLSCKFIGAAISVFEMSLLTKRFDAIMNINFPQEHRDFLSALTFDQHGFPLYENQIAGIDACFEISKS